MSKTVQQANARPVLVVDDYPDGRELLAEYLQYRGFSVVAANSGAEALAIAAQIRPAAILMDLRMPDMDGWEATRRLRGDPATRDIMIVAVTAAALTDEVEKALRAGCDAVVAKPYDLTTFADALAVAVVEGPEAFRALGAPTRRHPRTGASGRSPGRGRAAGV